MRGRFDAFFKITAQWHLTQAERRALLGLPTDERWFHFVRDTVPEVTPEETARVQAVIRIDELLSACGGTPYESTHWVRTLESKPPFLGKSPLELMARGNEGFKQVAEYLRTQRQTVLQHGR